MATMQLEILTSSTVVAGQRILAIHGTARHSGVVTTIDTEAGHYTARLETAHGPIDSNYLDWVSTAPDSPIYAMPDPQDA